MLRPLQASTVVNDTNIHKPNSHHPTLRLKQTFQVALVREINAPIVVIPYLYKYRTSSRYCTRLLSTGNNKMMSSTPHKDHRASFQHTQNSVKQHRSYFNIKYPTFWRGLHESEARRFGIRLTRKTIRMEDTHMEDDASGGERHGEPVVPGASTKGKLKIKLRMPSGSKGSTSGSGDVPPELESGPKAKAADALPHEAHIEHDVNVAPPEDSTRVVGQQEEGDTGAQDQKKDVDDTSQLYNKMLCALNKLVELDKHLLFVQPVEVMATHDRPFVPGSPRNHSLRNVGRQGPRWREIRIRGGGRKMEMMKSRRARSNGGWA